MDIIKYFQELTFLPAGYFSYNSVSDIINYDPKQLKTNLGRLSLLHETSHALLGHLNYNYDLELLILEVKAWAKARELVHQFNISIDENYIEECLDSYDYWVSARATCPNCSTFCLQTEKNLFRCFVCGIRWRVSDRKDCQVRRRKVTV